MKPKINNLGKAFLKNDGLSITTGSIWPKSTLEAIDVYSSLGLTNLEVTLQPNEFILDFDGNIDLSFAEKISKISKMNGVKVATVHAPRMVDEQSFSLKGKMRILEKSIEACAILGGGILTLHPVHVFTTYEDAQDFILGKLPLKKAVLGNFWKALSEANSRKICIALENIRNFSWDNFFNDAVNMSKIIDQVSEPNFGITLDLYHSELAGNTDSFLNKLGDKIINIHTADISKDKKRVAPGLGTCRWSQLLDSIRRNTKAPLLTLELLSFSEVEIGEALQLLNGWKKSK